MRAKNRSVGYWFVAPATIHLLAFAIVPILYALYLSFFKWDILKDQKPFVALRNYTDTFADASFWNAMWNSTRYVLASVPLGMIVALAVALLVNQKVRGLAIFRTIFYIPAISSGVAISMLWIYVYLPKTGMIGATFKIIGLPSDIDWLGLPSTAMWALVFMSIWTGLGPRMVLFLSGLIAIPQSLYEAAELDGASRWKCFRHVTIPMLTNTTFFVLVTSTIAAFQVFTPIYMMTLGGPENSTDVIGFHIYTEAWSNFHIGLASAKSFVLLIVMIAISAFQFRLMRDQLRSYSAS